MQEGKANRHHLGDPGPEEIILPPGPPSRRENLRRLTSPLEIPESYEDEIVPVQASGTLTGQSADALMVRSNPPPTGEVNPSEGLQKMEVSLELDAKIKPRLGVQAPSIPGQAQVIRTEGGGTALTTPLGESSHYMTYLGRILRWTSRRVSAFSIA